MGLGPFLFSFYYLLQSGNITRTYAHVCCELTHMRRMRSTTTTPPHHDPHAHVADVEDALVYRPPMQRRAATSINKEVQEVLEHAKVQGPHPWFLPFTPPLRHGVVWDEQRGC